MSIDMLNTILWLTGGHQKRIFQRLGQPVTATQLSRLFGIPADTCSYVLVTLSQRKLVRCINPVARRSRLYWLTRLGRAWQRRLRALDGMSPITHDYPDLDWTPFLNKGHDGQSLAVFGAPQGSSYFCPHSTRINTSVNSRQ